MLTIPATIQTLFKTDGVRKNFRVHFPNGEYSDITNENIVRESVHFTESLCSQEVFKFGLAEASVIEFETVGIGNMYGMTTECAYEIDTSSLSAGDISAIEADPGDGVLVKAVDSDIGYGFYRVPLGTFRVESCPRNHGAMTHRRVSAYSSQMQFLSGKSFPFLDWNLPWSEITVDSFAIMNFVYGGGLTVDQQFTVDARSAAVDYDEYFWDSAGESYLIYLQQTSGGTWAPFTMQGVFGYPGQTGGDSFVRVDSALTKAQYEAFGAAVAEAITQAGIDLTYDDTGAKIYYSNVDALRKKCPFMFGPAVRYFVGKSGSGYNAYYPINLNGIAPLIMPKRTGVSSAFAVDDSKAKTGLVYAYITQLATWSGGSANTFNIFISNNGTTTQIPITLPFYVPNETTITTYTIPPSGSNMHIRSSSQTTFKVWNVGNSGPVLADVVPSYGYVDTFPIIDQLNGALEVRGCFSRTGRDGSEILTTLNPASPIPIYSADIDRENGGCWWDEYNVEPIGTVIVTYQTDRESTASFTIGTGASVYDMEGNAVLQSLANASMENIQTLLSGDFATNAANAGFTPVDLTMQGWPWMEAGDALEITAEDGTVVDTYALRIEMSGIQHLTAAIQSQGGEIIGEV